MNRIDLYGAIHKAQRHHLCRLLDDLGRVDDTDTTAVTALLSRLAKLVSHLHEHAAHEERFIHPLLARVAPQDAAALEAQHVALAPRLAELATVGASPGAAYLALARFLAAYLEHMDEEERLQRHVLWPKVSDADLRSVMQAFKDSLAPAALLANAQFLLPALNPRESALILGAPKAS